MKYDSPALPSHINTEKLKFRFSVYHFSFGISQSHFPPFNYFPHT